MPLCQVSHKTDIQKCDKNISNENYAKLRNSLSKMKELDQFSKKPLHFNKGAPLFDKRALGQSRRTGGG